MWPGSAAAAFSASCSGSLFFSFLFFLIMSWSKSEAADCVVVLVQGNHYSVPGDTVVSLHLYSLYSLCWASVVAYPHCEHGQRYSRSPLWHFHLCVVNTGKVRSILKITTREMWTFVIPEVRHILVDNIFLLDFLSMVSFSFLYSFSFSNPFPKQWFSLDVHFLFFTKVCVRNSSSHCLLYIYSFL